MEESTVFSDALAKKEKAQIVNVNLKITLTDEDIDDIMSSALEGGINYWCRKLELVGDQLGEFVNEQISHGGSINIYATEDNNVYELTKEKFINGLKMYLENHHFSSYENRGQGSIGLDVGMIDAIAADLIIQYALFADIVYG